MNYANKKENGITTFEIRDQIGILTINNGIQNKLSNPKFVDLSCLKAWISEQELKGLIITGNGRNFSTGADVDNLFKGESNSDCLGDSLEKGKEILNYIETLPLVTVASIGGACFGGGLEIALSCQFRVGRANCMLALPESSLGIMPGMGGTIRLTNLIGKSAALKMILSASTISGQEAFELGLLDRVVQSKDHLSETIKFINELTDGKSNQQIRNIVKAVNNTANYNTTESSELECEMFLELLKILKDGDENNE